MNRRLAHDVLVVLLLFTGAAAGVIAASGVEGVPPLVKLGAGAWAAGCGAVLAVLSPVTTKRPQ